MSTQPEPLRLADAPDEICRINADGTTTYHWDRIKAAAQRWTPGCADIAVCLAKLLLSLRRRKWRGLSEEERRECTASPFVVENYLAIEAALKEKNHE